MEVREAAEVANALEFIEANELQMVFDDSANVLLNAWMEKKNEIVEKVG